MIDGLEKSQKSERHAILVIGHWLTLGDALIIASFVSFHILLTQLTHTHNAKTKEGRTGKESCSMALSFRHFDDWSAAWYRNHDATIIQIGITFFSKHRSRSQAFDRAYDKAMIEHGRTYGRPRDSALDVISRVSCQVGYRVGSRNAIRESDPHQRC